MSDETEKARAQSEATRSSGAQPSSRAASTWTGLLRYLTGEAQRAHRLAERERRDGQPPRAG